MAKRKSGGMGILPVVAVFLGLLAAGAGYGLFHFYNELDRTRKEEIPALEEKARKAEAATKKALDRWNELAPWVLDREGKVEKPEDFDARDGVKVVDEQIVKPITARFAKPEWGADEGARKEYARRDKLKLWDVISDQQKEIESLRKSAQAAQESEKKRKLELDAALDQKNKVSKEKDARIDALNREVAEKARQVSEANRVQEERVAELNSKIEAANSVAKDIQQEAGKEISVLRNEKLQLVDKLREISEVKSVKVASLEPDGEITGVDQELGLAWIDLGKHQRIQRGMQFVVFAMGRGGVPREKGKIEVRSVEGDFSKVGILSQLDEHDPIVAGDQIANPVYHPKDTPVFVLCGQMERYSREDLARLIEENGGRVQAQVSVGTDFLVAGGERVKYENEQNFRDALQMGTRVMSEDELLRYLPHYGERR